MLTVRLFRREDGSSAVEFAIVASLLLLLLFGIVTFGLAYHRVQGLQAAAREAARLGSLRDTTVDDIRTRARDAVSILDPADLADAPCAVLSAGQGCIEVFRQPGTGSPVAQDAAGDKPCFLSTARTVIVEITYRMELPIPLWASPTITIAGRGEFRCEQ